MEKIFGVLVTYNPTIASLEKNLESIILQLDQLIVFDNGSNNIDEIKDLQKKLNFQIIDSPNNVGIGKAYNSAIFSNINCCDFFVTFDQDTFVPANAISTLLLDIKENEQIGVIGPSFSRDFYKVSKDGNVKFVPVIIQSCAIFRSNAIRDIGGFNEKYFIDSVDFEYCLRLIKNNYKVAIHEGVVIQHELGVAKSFWGIKYYSHNKFRNYFIARNHVDLSRRFYKTFPIFILKKNISLLIHFFKLIIFEKDSEKIKYFLKGIQNKPL